MSERHMSVLTSRFELNGIHVLHSTVTIQISATACSTSVAATSQDALVQGGAITGVLHQRPTQPTKANTIAYLTWGGILGITVVSKIMHDSEVPFFFYSKCMVSLLNGA